MTRPVLSVLLLAAVSAAWLTGCSPKADAPRSAAPAQSSAPSWVGSVAPEPAVPAEEFEALLPAIRGRASRRPWGPRVLPQELSLGTPIALHSYSTTASATFWGGVDPSVAGYAVPILDSGQQTIAVVLVSAVDSSTGPLVPLPTTEESTGLWAIRDVGYPQWEGLPASRSLYSEVASMVAEQRALLGPGAVIRVADDDGATAILGTFGSTAAFAYALGQEPRNTHRVPGLEPGVVVTGAEALAAARGMSHEPRDLRPSGND